MSTTVLCRLSIDYDPMCIPLTFDEMPHQNSFTQQKKETRKTVYFIENGQQNVSGRVPICTNHRGKGER